MIKICPVTMSAEEFLLKWNSHQSSIIEVFDEMLEKQTFVDVTLSCEDRNFAAHKMILSACSSYFKELFLKHPCSHPVIFLKDVNSKDLDALLRFLYKGEVNIRQEDLGSLLTLAKSLKVKGLTDVNAPKEGQQFDTNEEDSLPYADPEFKNCRTNTSCCRNIIPPLNKSVSRKKIKDIADILSQRKILAENDTRFSDLSPLIQSDSSKSQVDNWLKEEPEEENWHKGNYMKVKSEDIGSAGEDVSCGLETTMEECNSQPSGWLPLGHLVEPPQSIPLYLSLMGDFYGGSSYLRTKHAVDANGPEEEIKCHICMKQFSSKTHLRRHSLIHSGVKPFACTVCSKKFYRPDHLKVHMKTHSRVKEFECPYCDHRFVSKQSLENHIFNSCPARPEDDGQQRCCNSNSSASELCVAPPTDESAFIRDDDDDMMEFKVEGIQSPIEKAVDLAPVRSDGAIALTSTHIKEAIRINPIHCVESAVDLAPVRPPAETSNSS